MTVTLVDILKTRIRFLLAVRGESSQQVSLRLKRSKGWLYGFLDGESQDELSLEDIEKVARALEVEPVDLLDVRALRSIAGLHVDDLIVAHAFHHETNEEKKSAIRDMLRLKEEIIRGRKRWRQQRGRTSSTGRDHAADFQQAPAEETAPKRRARHPR